ncbi:hypothetical protein ANAPC5_01384 [Anaplasma phagocytophilum]|nr:hypothetical protein ANAPC5_01384 [Anaplasma phagocytophilum]
MSMLTLVITQRGLMFSGRKRRQGRKGVAGARAVSHRMSRDICACAY